MRRQDDAWVPLCGDGPRSVRLRDMTAGLPPIDADRCPLCGAANGCQFDEVPGLCWCTSERADAELVRWVRAHGMEAACLCRVCLVGGARSPCTDVCALDAEGVTCTGCGRTSPEIAAWSGMTPVQRAAVLLRLRGARG